MDVLERDFYDERRRKWRRSAFWRGVLVTLLLIIGLVVIAGLWGGDLRRKRPHVARVAVTGLITDDRDRDLLLAELAEDTEARAVIVAINSPGGTTAGSEALFDSLRRIAAEKPVVAQIGEMAASGGYVAAIAADHVVARGNSLTGSIGVIMEYPDLTEAMSRLGIGWETVRSSELKAEPSPFRPTSPAARALDEAMVADSFAWFRGLVGERRGLEGPALDAVATGGVFTGRLAAANGLVDEIGGEPEAVAWLESRDSALEGLDVVDWEVAREGGGVGGILGGILGRITATTGIFNEISTHMGPALYSLAR